jgi:tRNA(Arg) A34 adenosine deaminase TadA
MSKRFSKVYQLIEPLIKKRDAQNKASGFNTVFNSYHMCVVLKKGEPLTYGANTYKPKTTLNEHAEIQALRKLMSKFGKKTKKMKVDLFVLRTNKSNSKPCSRCMNEMMTWINNGKINIQTVYYTSKEEDTGVRSVKFSKLFNEERHYCSYDIHHNKNI